MYQLRKSKWFLSTDLRMQIRVTFKIKNQKFQKTTKNLLRHFWGHLILCFYCKNILTTIGNIVFTWKVIFSHKKSSNCLLMVKSVSHENLFLYWLLSTLFGQIKDVRLITNEIAQIHICQKYKETLLPTKVYFR